MEFKNHLVKVFAAVLLIGSMHTLLAQETETKEDSITISNDFKGIVTFETFKKDGEVIKHKSYQLNADRLDPSSSDYFNKLSLKGDYNENDRDKAWKFSYKKLAPSKSVKIEDYKVVQLGTGEEYVINANFRKGKAEGEWNVANRIINNSSVDTATFKAQTQFKNNTILGELKSSCDSIDIRGQINDEGFFDGEWIFYHKNDADKSLSEHRMYEEGVLVAHRIKIEDETFDVNHVGLDKTADGEDELWEEVNINRDYFNIIFKTNFGVENDALSLDETNQLIGKSNAFLKYSIFSFGRFNEINIWQIDDGKDIEYPKLKVRKFPYSDEEKKQITEALKEIKESKKTVKNYLDDPQVDINKHSYREVALYFEIYSKIVDELDQLENVFNLFNHPSYAYINREKIIPYVFDGINYPDSVSFEYDDKKTTASVDFPQDLNSKEATFDRLFKAVQEINDFIEDKDEIVSPIIERNKKRAEIADQEELAIDKRDSVINLFSNKHSSENFNDYHKRFKTKVIDFTKEAFKRYAQQEIEKRIEAIDGLLNCFDAFINLYEKLESLPEKEAYIKELYTRTVWNPYTFTDMDETVKERVYNAFEKQILPHIIDDLYQSVNCEKVTVKTENIQLAYDKMKSLREQDTKQIEREIKRENDISKIIKAFSLSLN